MIRLGVDFGGTKIEAAALDETGAILARVRRPNPGAYDPAVAVVSELVAEVEALAHRGSVSRVGLGIPGSISPRTKEVRNANSTWLNGRAFDADLKNALGREVRLANDANCFALSEATDGAGAGARVVFGVILGTGCGGGLVVDGQVIEGINGVAGELGHTPLPWLNDDDRPSQTCWCGRPDCLELWISGSAFVADYRRVSGETCDGAQIMARARQGDEAARKVFDRYVDRLARALALIGDMMDPDVIVLGGGMSNIAELYDRIPPLMSRWIFSDILETRVVQARHGDSSGVRGARMALALRGVIALCRDCFWSGGDPSTQRCPRCRSPRLVRHAALTALSIAHLDCDAFYAAVEKRDRPQLRDEPVIVGGGVRGVVTTCCYIARTYGVRSAMPMFKALKACPQATVVKPNFLKYRHESRRIMAMLRDLTPLVQPLSLDEAWLDLTGTERLNDGFPALVLARVQHKIEHETGLTVSVGLAVNKFLAKIASDLDKPRGFSVLGEEASAFLARKPVSILPGVGPAFVKGLSQAGFRVVGDLARADPRVLSARFGASGERLAQLARGEDDGTVEGASPRKSLSAETTFDRDIASVGGLEDKLWPLCEKVASHARRENISGRAVTLKLKGIDFKTITRRRTLATPAQTARTLFAAGREMLIEATAAQRPYRLIGVGISDLTVGGDLSQELFATDEARARSAETAIDALRSRFGDAAIVSGRAFHRSKADRKDAGEPQPTSSSPSRPPGPNRRA